MVTDEERREVARKLRELPIDMPSEIGKWEEGGLFIEPSIYDEADYSQIHNVLFDCFPAEHMHPCDYDELHHRLADLIEPEPERTCIYVYDEESAVWRCSECGGLEPVGDHVRYCPDCGAKVVEE